MGNASDSTNSQETQFSLGGFRQTGTPDQGPGEIWQCKAPRQRGLVESSASEFLMRTARGGRGSGRRSRPARCRFSIALTRTSLTQGLIWLLKPKLFSRAFRLARSQCCNFAGSGPKNIKNYCWTSKESGYQCSLIQNVRCEWFEVAVLPTKPDLEAAWKRFFEPEQVFRPNQVGPNRQDVSAENSTGADRTDK